MKWFIFVLTSLCLVPGAGSQTPPADLQRRLPALTGIERARALAELTDLLKNDQPRLAIAYATEALRLFAVHPDATTQVRVLNEGAWAHMVLGEYDQAIARATEGRTLAERESNRRGFARAVNNLGVIAQRRGDPVSAVESFGEALAIYRDLRDELDIASALNNLGFVHATDLADYEKGLAYHVEALAVRERLGDTASIALSLNNIGIVYGRLGEHERALEYFERSLELRRGLGSPNRVAATLHNIGDTHIDRRDFPRALEYHKQALQIRTEIGDKSGLAISHTSLGSIYTSMDNLDLAERHLAESSAMAEKQGDQQTAGRALLELSRLNRRRGRAQQAVELANRAHRIAEQTRGQELARRALEELAAGQEQAGRLAAALASYKRFKRLSDEIFDAERTKRVEMLERRYQSEKREREIERLKGERIQNDLTAAEHRAQRNIVGGAALLFGVVGFGLYRRRVESARIAEQLSTTDTLTGLVNRRYVLQTIGADVAASARRHRAAAADGAQDADLLFILIDIDHFKSVNDTFGHDAGDLVLQQVAGILRDTCRTSDIIVRWGGEEFLVVCRFIGREVAATLAERIRAEVSQHVFDLGNGRTVRRTCSIGVAAFPFVTSEPESRTWQQIVTLADEALYQAKESGRDRWVIASAEDRIAPPR